MLLELDPDRPYVPSSPHGGENDSNSGGIGDQHYWDVWHGRGDWQHYRDSSARFSSEYGFASSCSMRAWRTVFAEPAGESLPGERVTLQSLRASLRDPIVRWHDKTAKGYEVFLSYAALHYPEPETLADWVYYSQLNQRDALRCALEHYRRSQFCKGSLIWQLNDCWPVQSWALIDSEGQPKSAWFELRRLHAPALMSITLTAEHAELHLGLDNARAPFLGNVSLRAVSLLTGADARSVNAEFSVANGERCVPLRLPLAGLHRRSTLLVANCGSISAQALLAEPKELELANPEPLSVSVADGVLELRSTTPLIDLVLTDASGTAAFFDNCVTLPHPGVTRLRYRGQGHGLEARSLAGRHPLTVPQAR